MCHTEKEIEENHHFVRIQYFVCFISDETSKDAEYKLAQSGDATCNGLDSAEVCCVNKCMIQYPFA